MTAARPGHNSWIGAQDGTVPAHPRDMVGAFSSAPEDVLEATEEEEIGPVLDTFEKGHGRDFGSLATPWLCSLAFVLDDFKTLAEAGKCRE